MWALKLLLVLTAFNFISSVEIRYLPECDEDDCFCREKRIINRISKESGREDFLANQVKLEENQFQSVFLPNVLLPIEGQGHLNAWDLSILLVLNFRRFTT